MLFQLALSHMSVVVLAYRTELPNPLAEDITVF